MLFIYIVNITLWLTLFCPLNLSLGTVAKKTKLCGDEACSEKLFEGKFHRSSVANHESFLSPNENDVVNVYAIKFSDRTDLMEGALALEPAKRGNFFTMHINLDGYVDFLRNAILSNKTMFMISMDPRDHPLHRLVGVKAAVPELIKDYEVNAMRLAEERQLPPPEPINYTALGYVPDTAGHGHSHTHGHGHSHDQDHEHSHVSAHSHEHEHVHAEQHLQQPVNPSTETALPPPPVTNIPKSVPQEVPVPSIQQQQVQNAKPGEQVSGAEMNAPQNIPKQHVSQHEPAAPLPNEPASPQVLSDEHRITKDSTEDTTVSLPHEPAATLTAASSQKPASEKPPDQVPLPIESPPASIEISQEGKAEHGVPMKGGKQPSNPEAETQIKDEVRTDIMEEDGLGYCIKGECDKVYNLRQDHNKIESGYLMTVGRWLSKLMGIVRYILPSQMRNFDDAGILVTLSVPICLIIHLVRMLVFADISDRDTFDRRMLHNALTAVRERDVQMRVLHAEAEKGKCAVTIEKDKKFDTLQSEMRERLVEIQHLKTKCRILEEENDDLKVERNEKSQLVEKERAKCRDLTEQNKKLEAENKMITSELSEVRAAMDASLENAKCLDCEVANKNAQLTRLESEAKSRLIEVKNLKDQLKTSLAESKMLHQRVEELQNEIVQLSEIIEEMRDKSNVAAGGSSVARSENIGNVREDENGEGGWSDFDELDADNSLVSEKSKKERSLGPRLSPADIMEVARLRVQLKNVEADLDQAKLALQRNENEREHFMRKVELAESEAAKRMKEVDAKEAERIEAHNQFKRILAMVEERETKLRINEELTERLRNEVAKWQEEVRHLEEQKKAVELKLLEADQELKRLKAEYSRLETRNFHEVRECKQTIVALQQSLEQARLSHPPSNVHENANLLNFSASSSDRDFGAPLGTGLVAPPLPQVRPLWDDEPVEMFSSGGESSVIRNKGPLLNDRSTPENGNITFKRGTRSRRSNRDREHNSGANDVTQTRHKKEGRRMRSRSQGRHPMHSDYCTTLGMPTYQADLYTSAVLSKQRSKSGTLYYSSGGSNDGRSPPPEIALLSGIPPPGPMIKKPTPRPKSGMEEVERRQN